MTSFQTASRYFSPAGEMAIGPETLDFHRTSRRGLLAVARAGCIAGLCLASAMAQATAPGSSPQTVERRAAEREQAPARDRSIREVAAKSLPGASKAPTLPAETIPKGETSLEIPAGELTPGSAELTGEPSPAEGSPAKPESQSNRRDYRIGYGDVLQISVWREPDASAPQVTVRSDGRISVPLVKEISAVGLTPGELSAELTKAYARFIASPEVTVIVQEIHSEKVYLVGGVTKPGAVQLRSPMTVLQVLAESGGFTEFAKTGKIYVLRKEGDETVQLQVDYRAILKGKSLEQNIFVRPGDTIVVPQ